LLADGGFALLQRLLVPWRRRPGRDADATVAADEPLPAATSASVS
jgi:hypothetical protein